MFRGAMKGGVSSPRMGGLRGGEGMGRAGSCALDVLGIVLVFGGVAVGLTLKVDLVLLDVSVKDVVRAHAENLG